MAKGDVQIDKLKLDIGPASITGQGGAKGLNTDSPQIAGLQLQSHDLDPQKLAAYYPPLRKQLGNQFAGPVGITVHGSGQTLEVKIDLTPVKVTVPDQLTKAAGQPMTIVAHLSAAQRVDAKIDLEGVDLRPGQSVDKSPGQRLNVALTGTRKGERIDIADLKAHIIDDELEGRGFYDQGKFDLALQSSHLDLDKILLPGKAAKKEEKPPDPKTYAGLDGHAGVKIDRLTYKKQTVTDIVADVTMKEDDVKVNTASLKAFGGTASAGGTELKLAHPKEPFHVVTKLAGVGLESLVALVTRETAPSGA